jgi:hypothetical protein
LAKHSLSELQSEFEQQSPVCTLPKQQTLFPAFSLEDKQPALSVFSEAGEQQSLP